jgi:hypothetical protein
MDIISFRIKTKNIAMSLDFVGCALHNNSFTGPRRLVHPSTEFILN